MTWPESATSADDILAYLAEIKKKMEDHMDVIAARRELAAMDAHLYKHPEMWSSDAVNLKLAMEERVLAITDADKRTVPRNRDSNLSHVSLRMSSLARSISDSASSRHPIDTPSSSAGGNLLRSFGSFIGVTMAETYYCQICLEYVDIATTFTLDGCGHRFCVGCIKGYLASKIQDGLVYPKCFYLDPELCNAKIEVDDIRALASDATWEKYEKFKFFKENAAARECPYCHHVQVGSGTEDPMINCTACSQEFCFTHSNAHPGTSCAEYEAARRAEEKLNQAMISQISKPCPGCQTPVEKSGGCNQMKCITCGVNFCWLCGKEVDSGVFPEHFQWWNLAGCAGSQMSESSTGKPSLFFKLTWFLFRLFLCLVFGPPALALTLAFSAVACCCIPCLNNSRETARSAFLGCFCVSGWVFMAPVVLVLLLPFAPFYLLAWCCFPTHVPSPFRSFSGGHDDDDDDEHGRHQEDTDMSPYRSA
ncbi:E3 ubiquitin-protein ligase rnf19b [Aphanomyces cochlioides]|nr:E3 ubiquitin-protein ligase rnf19b [Aphanomyces cochlioides]